MKNTCRPVKKLKFLLGNSLKYWGESLSIIFFAEKKLNFLNFNIFISDLSRFNENSSHFPKKG